MLIIISHWLLLILWMSFGPQAKII